MSFGRLDAGNGYSALEFNVSDPVELLRSFLDTLADLNDFEWSQDVRDAIFDQTYKTFWGPHSHCFTSEPIPVGMLLSAHQAITDPQYGADIPGMPCGHMFKKGDCCYKCK
jgi:E3 ubiquitin-protein ligase UBR1